MTRTTDYRGFQIHVELAQTSEDMFDVWFRIEGPMEPAGVAALGKRIKAHGGPFSRRWAHLVGRWRGAPQWMSFLALRTSLQRRRNGERAGGLPSADGLVGRHWQIGLRLCACERVHLDAGTRGFDITKDHCDGDFSGIAAGANPQEPHGHRSV